MIKNYLRFWWVILIIVIPLSLLIWFWPNQSSFTSDYQLILPNGQIAKIRLLTTQQDKYTGFSNQDRPCADCGLLFVWPTLLQPIMVMREMRFPLDFIWLKDKQIIQLTSDVQPESGPDFIKYQSDRPVDAVLEMPAGFIYRHNLQIGQSLDWR